jgi:NTE family protein
VPETPAEISDRRNHLAGNLSLQHELQIIDMWNMLIQEGALTDRFRARFGIEAKEPIVVHFIRMSQELQDGLDYPSKLSRQPDHIERLKADGRLQADVFLTKIGGGRPPSTANGTLVEQVEMPGGTLGAN